MIEYNKFKRKIVAPLNFACCETFFTGTIESVISAIDGTALCTSIRGWKRKLVAGRWHLSLINRSNSAKRTVIRTRSKGKPPPSSLFSSSPPLPLPPIVTALYPSARYLSSRDSWLAEPFENDNEKGWSLLGERKRNGEEENKERALFITRFISTRGHRCFIRILEKNFLRVLEKKTFWTSDFSSSR